MTLENLIQYAWDSEALCLFCEGRGPLLQCIDQVIARYLFAGDNRPWIDALIRSQHVPDPRILRLVGEMHDPSPATSPEVLPYRFITVHRETGRVITLGDRWVYLWSDLLEDLKAGDVRSLARMFKAGRHPDWAVLSYYAEMHDDRGSTLYRFVLKHRCGKHGRRLDPEMDHANWLAAANVERLKQQGMGHELACRKVAQWMSVETLKSKGVTHVAALREVVRRTSDLGTDSKEEWVRKAFRKHGAHCRKYMSS